MPFTALTARSAAKRSHKHRETCEACFLVSAGIENRNPHHRPLHSCPDFPLPSWTTAYLAAFDAHLSGEHAYVGMPITVEDAKRLAGQSEADRIARQDLGLPA